jgi:hypothetical protein
MKYEINLVVTVEAEDTPEAFNIAEAIEGVVGGTFYREIVNIYYNGPVEDYSDER